MAALWDFVVLILIIQTVNGRSIETISGLLEESVKNCTHRLSKLEALLTEELKLQCGSPLPTEALLSNLTQWELEVKLNPVPELCYSLLASVQSVCHQQNVQLDPALLSLDSKTFCSKASTLKLADCEDTDCKVVVMTVEHVMGRQEHCKQKCLEDDTVLPVCLSLFYVKSAQSGNSAQLDNSGQSGKDSENVGNAPGLEESDVSPKNGGENKPEPEEQDGAADTDAGSGLKDEDNEEGKRKTGDVKQEASLKEDGEKEETEKEVKEPVKGAVEKTGPDSQNSGGTKDNETDKVVDSNGGAKEKTNATLTHTEDTIDTNDTNDTNANPADKVANDEPAKEAEANNSTVEPTVSLAPHADKNNSTDPVDGQDGRVDESETKDTSAPQLDESQAENDDGTIDLVTGNDSPSKVTREESTQKLPTDSKAPVPDPAAVAPGQEEGAQSPPAVAPGQEAPGETQPTPAEKKEAVEEGNGGEGGEAGEGDAGDAVGGGEKVEVGGVGGGGSGSGGETDAEAQIGGEEEQKGQVEEAGEAGQEGAYDEVLEDDEDGGGLLEQPPPGLHKMDEQAEKQQGQSKGVDTMNAGSDYEEKSNFFAYFVGLSFVCILAYLVFHNKQKILALILEGRRHQGSRRRSAGREYRKLDTNVEDSMDLTRRSSARQVIY